MNSTSTFFVVNAVLLCAVNICFTFVGIFLNSVVVVSLLSSQLRRKLCYLMIVVLACCDLAVIVVFHPLSVFEALSCWVLLSCSYSDTVPFLQYLFALSLTALLTMTVERYLALVHPFYHEKCLTKSRLMAIFVAFQLPFGIFHILRELYLNSYMNRTILLVLPGTVLIVILGLNYKIFCVARTIKKRTVIPMGRLSSDPGNNVVKKPNFQKVSTCSLAVACLLLCYCPFVIHSVLRLFRVTQEWNDQTLRIVQLWNRTFACLNSSLNCLIFFYRNSALRRHADNFLKKCMPKTYLSRKNEREI